MHEDYPLDRHVSQSDLFARGIAVVGIAAAFTSTNGRMQWLTYLAAAGAGLLCLSRPVEILAGIRQVGWWGTGLLLWAAASLFWSEFPSYAFSDYLSLLGIVGISVITASTLTRWEYHGAVGMAALFLLGATVSLRLVRAIFVDSGSEALDSVVLGNKNTFGFVAGIGCVWASSRLVFADRFFGEFERRAYPVDYFAIIGGAFCLYCVSISDSLSGVALAMFSIPPILLLHSWVLSKNWGAFYVSAGYVALNLIAVLVKMPANFPILGEDFGVVSRKVIWQSAVDAIRDGNELTGYGIGVWRQPVAGVAREIFEHSRVEARLSHLAYAHNTLLDVQLQLGLVGVALWLAVFFICLQRNKCGPIGLLVIAAAFGGTFETRFPGDFLTLILFAGLCFTYARPFGADHDSLDSGAFSLRPVSEPASTHRRVLL